MTDSSVQAVESADLQFVDTMEGFTDLEKATKGNQTIQRIVDTQYQCLKVKDVFKNLILSGSLIDLAYKSAGKEPCSASILKIMGKYQDVVAASAVQSKVCVEASTKVVKAHKAIREKFQANKPEKSLKALEQWANLSKVAQKMHEASAETVKQVDELIDLGEKALKHVQDGLIGNDKLRTDIKELIADARANNAMYEKSSKDLAKLIEDARAEEVKHEADAQKERDRAHQLAMTGAILGGLATLAAGPVGMITKAFRGDDKGGGGSQGGGGDEARAKAENDKILKDKEVTRLEQLLAQAKAGPEKGTKIGKEKIAEIQADLEKAKEGQQKATNAWSKAANEAQKLATSADDKAQAAASHRRRMQQQQAEDQANLAKSIKALETNQNDKADVEKVIKNLGIALHAMGQVKTTFLQVRTFWKSVSDACVSLQDPARDVEYLVKELERGWETSQVRDQWEISLAGWAALGSVNIQAYRALEEAGVNIDEKMSNLDSKTTDEVREMALKLGMEVEKAAEAAEKLIANETMG